MTDALRSVLERLERDSQKLFESAAVSIHVERHEARPFSDVWRANVAGAPRTTAIYIKVAKLNAAGPSLDVLRARLRSDFETTTRVHHAMSPDPHLAAVRPIACFPEDLALVTEEVPGVNLLRLLEVRTSRWTRDETPEAVFEHAGRWIRRFQEIEGTAAPLPFDTLREYMDVRLRRLTTKPAAAFDESGRRRVLSFLDARRSEVDASDLIDVAIHGDFAPANAIADGSRVAVLDFAMNKRGTKFHDISRFHMQMALLKLKPQQDGRAVALLQSALLRGYQADLSASRPVFQVLLLLHTINHFETLVTKAATFPSNLYNRYVARRHRRWILDTVTSPGRSSARD
jgi:hypothetical protein